MQHDQPHSLQHPLLQVVHRLVLYLPPVLVAPVYQNVRIIQNPAVKALHRILHGGCGHCHIRIFPQEIRYGTLHAMGIYPAHLLHGFWQRAILRPDMNMHLSFLLYSVTHSPRFAEARQASTNRFPITPSAKVA